MIISNRAAIDIQEHIAEIRSIHLCFTSNYFLITLVTTTGLVGMVCANRRKETCGDLAGRSTLTCFYFCIHKSNEIKTNRQASCGSFFSIKYSLIGSEALFFCWFYYEILLDTRIIMCFKVSWMSPNVH